MIAVFRLKNAADMKASMELYASFNVFMSEDGRDLIVNGNEKSVIRVYENFFMHNLIDEYHASFPDIAELRAHRGLKSEKFALFILELISTPATRDAVVGCLTEARGKVKAQYGERKARIYFWWQVSRTIGHFAWAWVRRLRWIAVALGFLGWVARKFSSEAARCSPARHISGCSLSATPRIAASWRSRSSGRATKPCSNHPKNPN